MKEHAVQQLEEQLAGKQKELAAQPRKIQMQVEMSRLEREAFLLRQSTEKMQVGGRHGGAAVVERWCNGGVTVG